MKQLKTDILGGMPFVLDDLRWLADGFKESLFAMNRGLGDAFIIKGFELGLLSVGSDFFMTNTEGWVSIEGRVYFIAADPVGKNITTHNFQYLEPVIGFDSAGLKVFEDSTSHQTYEAGTAEIKVYTTAQTGKLPVNGFKTLSDVLRDKVVGSVGAVTFSPGWGNGINPVPNAGYRVDGKICHLFGDVKFSGPGFLGSSTVVTPTNYCIYALATEATPMHNHLFSVLATDGFTNGGAGQPDTIPLNPVQTWIYITTSGKVFIDPVVANTGKSIMLDCSYPTS